jgi:hypothetical protein
MRTVAMVADTPLSSGMNPPVPQGRYHVPEIKISKCDRDPWREGREERRRMRRGYFCASSMASW